MDKKSEKEQEKQKGVRYTDDDQPTEPDVILDIPEIKIDDP